MALVPQQTQPKYWPYKAPTLEQVTDIIKALPKPVINVTPVNRLVQQNVPAQTPYAWGTPNMRAQPKALPITNPNNPMQISQTWPNSFGSYKTPVPLQKEYMWKPIGWQPMQAPLDVPQPKKTPERYVAMDRRTELAQQQRQQVPELAKLPDDQIVEKFVTQFPQFQEYFKLPEPEQDPNQQIIEAIRRDYPEAQSMTDEQILQQWNQHQQAIWWDPTAPGAQEVAWWAIKTTPSHGGSWFLWMWNIPNINPILKYNKEKDAWAPNVGKLAVNLPWSTANVWINTLNMLNLWTVKWLSQIFLWAVANLTKWAKSLFVWSDQAEVDSAITLDRLKRKWGNLWKIAQFLDESEELADAVWRWIIEKYWNLDNVAKIITEDPMEIVSDIAMLIEWWGTFVKLVSKTVKAKTLANISEEVASFWAKSDPYNLTIASAWKTAQKTTEAFTTPSKSEWVSVTDRLISSYNGLDAQTVRMMKDNADLIKQLDDWTLSKEALQEKVIKVIDDLVDEKSEAWDLYQEAYKDRTTFDPQEIVGDIVNKLQEQWVIFNEAWTKIVDFDGTNPGMFWLNESMKSSIISSFKQAVKDLTRKEQVSVADLHAVRKNLNQAIYQVSNLESAKPRWIQKVVDWINVKLKKVPGFSKADKAFAEIATELSQIKKMLTTTDSEGKLHMKGTVKWFLSETGRRKLEVIERYYPDFRRNIEAIVAYDDYINAREKKKVWLYNKPVSWGAWWAVGIALGWPIGAIIGAVAWTMLHSFVTDPKRFKNRVVKKLGKKVAQKIAKWKALTRIEKARMDFEAERLLAKPQLALEYKPDLKTEKVQVVDTQWVVKWQPGAQTLQKQAIENWKIVTKTEVNASPIKIPGKKWNFPKQVKETWQENVREPRNAIKEEWAKTRKAEAQRRADIQSARQAKVTAYEKATWPTETNVSQFKKWMITPDGVITETWFNWKKAYYKVEWDGNFQYRYEGKAKQGSPIKVPWPANVAKELDPWEVKDEPSKLPETDLQKTPEQEAKEWMQNEIARMWYGDTETKLAQDVLRIEEMENNLGRVWRNKVKNKAYKESEEIKFLAKKERVISKIQEELGLDANDAKDRYDKQAYTAKDVKERYQTKAQALAFYHGTSENFMKFDPKLAWKWEWSWMYWPWVDLTDNLNIAKVYADLVASEKHGVNRKIWENPNSTRMQTLLKGKRNIKSVNIGWVKIYDILENKAEVNKFIRDSKLYYTDSEWDEVLQGRKIEDIDITDLISSDKELSSAVAWFVKEKWYDWLSYPIKTTQLWRWKPGKNYKIFDANKAEILKQEMYQIKENITKTHLSPEQAQAKIRKYFTEKEVPVIFQEKITTPRWQEAYGKYHDGAITMVKEPHLTTPDHEAFHAYFDLFTTKNRQAKVLEIVKKKQKIKDNLEAEEWLADNFAEFVAKRETFTWAIKAFFWDVRNGIKKVFGKEDAVRSLYTDMINKKRPWGDKKIRSEKTAKNQTTGVPYLTTKPLQDIGTEIKGADVTVMHLKNMLWRQYKKQELNQIMEVIRVAEEKWVDKLSKADVQEIMRKEILPLEIVETGRYADYNRLYRNEYLNEDNIHRTYWITHIYTAPIRTSNNNHFDNPNYFWHLRVEDLSKRTWYNENKWNIARVIEVQSDLFQRWDETTVRNRLYSDKWYGAIIKILDLQRKMLKISPTLDLDNKISAFYEELSQKSDSGQKIIVPEVIKKIYPIKDQFWDMIDIERTIEQYNRTIDDIDSMMPKEAKQLESYANKGAYRKRMVWQEIIEQVKAGKEKIQFPDGVTIAKIEWHEIDILTSWDVFNVWNWYLIQKEYFSNIVNKIVANKKVEDVIRESYVDRAELTELSNWRREDLDENIWTKAQFMDEAMESYMDMYGIEYDGALNFEMRDPAMFEDFLELHGWYEILKEVREKYPQRFADPKTLWWPWERTPEQAKEAIEWMRKDHQTIANFYETDLIPYLQKTFWWDFVFEDGWRWLEIDLKKTFGDQKKLGIPAFQKKDVYKEIDESFNRMLDQQMQYKKESGGRFTDWGIIAWIQNYLYNEYPQYKAHINDKIMEAVKKYNIKEKMDMPADKISTQQRALYTRSWKNAKWNTTAEKLYDMYWTTVLDPNTFDWLKKAWIPVTKSDMTKYYDLFFKKLPENVQFHDIKAWFDREIKRAYDYGYITEEKASVYQRLVSMLQEKQKWVPKFQTKTKSDSARKVQSYFQEKQKKWLMEAKTDEDIDIFKEERPTKIDWTKWYRIPWWGTQWTTITSAPMWDGMYIGFDKKSVASFYGDYEIPMEKNLERVKEYDTSNIKRGTVEDLPKELQKVKDYWRLPKKEQERIAQARKDYILSKWFDWLLYYDPYTANLIEWVVYKKVPEKGVPKLSSSKK